MAGSTWQGRAVHFMVHRKERGERRKRERERERERKKRPFKCILLVTYFFQLSPIT
jgi:hypothetical protein